MEHARPPSGLCLQGSSVSRADAWKKWKTQFMLFLKASGMHKEYDGVQASLLINLIGSGGFDVYETFTFVLESDKDDVTLLIKKFAEYFGMRQNITLARYNFFTRNQETGESIDQYVTALKLLSKYCCFKDLEEEIIRDRIVCGIASSIVRDRLLRTGDLTLEKAIKIVQVNEVSTDSGRLLETRGAVGAGESTSSAHVNGVGVRGAGNRAGWRGRGDHGARGAAGAASGSRAVRQAGASGHCLRCGGQCTEPGSCPATSVQCYVCENHGHFARMCRLKKSVKKVHDVGMSEEKFNDIDD